MDAVPEAEQLTEAERRPASFEDFFRESYRRLAQALLLLTADRGEAEELAQEALARVFERWNRVREMDSPSGYLYRTALNLNRKRLRSLAIRLKRGISSAPRPDPLVSAETRADLHRLLDSIPRGQREALVLVEWVGFSTHEAARVLGVASPTVRTRLHRARAALRKAAGDGYE
jgi:RNA polymerase sigma-70 factor (ECF subfamily)